MQRCMDYSGRLASSALGLESVSWDEFIMQRYREPSLLGKAFLTIKDLSVTFVHSRKQAKQTPHESNNTELILSTSLCRGGY